MSTYYYKCDATPSTLLLQVLNENGQAIWQVQYPSFIEDNTVGELIPEETIIDLGIIKDTMDIQGVESMLKKDGIIRQDDSVAPFEKEIVSDSFSLGGTMRFEAGKTLTEAEKKEIFRHLKDAYKVNNRPFEIDESTDRIRKIWLGESKDYMETSDITGARLRWYIHLPDGRIAHPTELYPNIQPSEAQRIQRNLEYYETLANNRYSQVMVELDKYDQRDLVFQSIMTAIQYKAKFKIEYDSNDIGLKNPSVYLDFGGRVWSVPEYVINSSGKYLDIDEKQLVQFRIGELKSKWLRYLSDIDWSRFLIETLKLKLTKEEVDFNKVKTTIEAAGLEVPEDILQMQNGNYETGGPINTEFYEADGKKIVVDVNDKYVYYIDFDKLDSYKDAKKAGKFFSSYLTPISEFEQILQDSPKFENIYNENLKFRKQVEEKALLESKEKEERDALLNEYLGTDKSVANQKRRFTLTKVRSIVVGGKQHKTWQAFIEFSAKQNYTSMPVYTYFDKVDEFEVTKDKKEYDAYVLKHGLPEKVKITYRIYTSDVVFVEVGKIPYDYFNFLIQKQNRDGQFELGGILPDYSFTRDGGNQIVTEDGQPKLVYHGTPNQFEYFKHELIGTNTEASWNGIGFYFSDKMAEALLYGEYIIKAHLRITNPLDLSKIVDNSVDGSGLVALFAEIPGLKDLSYEQKTIAEINQIVKSLEKEFNPENISYSEGTKTWFRHVYYLFEDKEYVIYNRTDGEINNPAHLKQIIISQILHERYGLTGLPIRPTDVVNPYSFTELLIENGFDGVIAENSTLPEGCEYVVFKLNQIKIISENNQEPKLEKGGALSDLHEANLATIRKIAKEENIRTEGDFIYLYHGTSPSNYKRILKTNRLNSGTWFAKDFDTAKTFGGQSISKGEPKVDYMALYMGSLYYNGYFSSMEDLYFVNGKYQPKNWNLESGGDLRSFEQNVSATQSFKTIPSDQDKYDLTKGFNKAILSRIKYNYDAVLAMVHEGKSKDEAIEVQKTKSKLGDASWDIISELIEEHISRVHNYEKGGISDAPFEYGDAIEFTENSEKPISPHSNVPEYTIGQKGYIKNIKKENGGFKYDITGKGMMLIVDVPQSHIKLNKEDIVQKIEERLNEKQAAKDFKDVGKRVKGSAKEKRAYTLITVGDLDLIEEDELTAFELVTKERVYPEVNVAEQRAAGVSSGAAYLKVKIREACGSKPPNEKQKRLVFTTFINTLTNKLNPLKTVAEVIQFLEHLRNLTIIEFTTYFISPLPEVITEERKKKLEDTFNQTFFSRSTSHAVKTVLEQVFGKRFSNFLYLRSDAAALSVAEAKKFEGVTIEQEAINLEEYTKRLKSVIKLNEEKIDAYLKYSEAELKQDTLNWTHGEDFKKDPEGFRKSIIGHFQRTIDAYKKGLQDIPDKLKQRQENWEWFEEKKGKKSIARSGEIQINVGVPLSYIKRTGGLVIKDEFVSQAQNTNPDENPITNTFGFKSAQFGNALKNTEAREHIRHFLGAMADIAETLDIDLKQLNSIGGLSIAIAARGAGKASAHYEPGRVIINITNRNGDGFVAHEFGHYFDNALTIFGRNQISLSYASENEKNNTKIVSQKVFESMKRLMEFIMKGKEGITPRVSLLYKATNDQNSIRYYDTLKRGYRHIELKSTIDETLEYLAQNSTLLDNTKDANTPVYEKLFGYIIKAFDLESYEVQFKPSSSAYYFNSSLMNSRYWIKPQELFARAWECYIFDKLANMGRMSNYLVSGVYFEDKILLMNGGYTYVYPFGEERKYLFTLFDELVRTVKSEFKLNGFVPFNTEREDEYLVLNEDKTNDSANMGVIAENDGEIDIIKDNQVATVKRGRKKKMEEGGIINPKDIETSKILEEKWRSELRKHNGATPKSKKLQEALIEFNKKHFPVKITLVKGVDWLSKKPYEYGEINFSLISGWADKKQFFNVVNGQYVPNELGKQIKIGNSPGGGSAFLKFNYTIDNVQDAKKTLEHDGYKVLITVPSTFNDGGFVQTEKEPLPIDLKGDPKPLWMMTEDEFFSTPMETTKNVRAKTFSQWASDNGHGVLQSVSTLQIEALLGSIQPSLTRSGRGKINSKLREVDKINALEEQYRNEVPETELKYYEVIEPTASGLAKRRVIISRALRTGKYEKAIAEGRMTVQDLYEIIESAEMEMPAGIILPEPEFKAKGEMAPISSMPATGNSNFEKYKNSYHADGSLFRPYDLRIEFADIIYGTASAKGISKLNQWLSANKHKYVKMFNGAGADKKDKILAKGILPTTAKRRNSIQSASGFVYLSVYPTMAQEFANLANPHSLKENVVFEVTTLIKDLKPDLDQLRNKRLWSEDKNIGDSLADSILIGHGARIKGKVGRDQIKILSPNNPAFF